jgi:uncharacterized protein YcaQ
MKKRRQSTSAWYSSVTKSDVQRVLTRIREEGPLSIRDIDDDVRVEKTHPWGSRKPSKRVLEFAFYTGRLAISQRSGMLKTYELIERHFGWTQSPKMASETRTVEYLLERALRSQGLVSLDSICHLDPKRKPAVHAAIERRVKRGELVPVVIDGAEKLMHWIEPRVIATIPDSTAETVHILSPFDPLIIQRKRLNLVFGYEHRFEAYLPKEKRLYGYFGLPILVDEEIVAVIDLKADRSARKLAVQKWTWTGTGDRSGNRTRIEEKLHQFERFQFEA